MNKEIEIKNDSIVLFLANLVTLLDIFLTRYLCNVIGISNVTKNIFSIIGFLFLCGLLYYTFCMFNKKKKENIKKNIVLTIVLVAIFVIVNVAGILIINKIVIRKYSKVTEEIVSYCKEYKCDKYETIKESKYLNFKIINEYEDYNKVLNTYEINNYCTTDMIYKMKIVVYSSKDSYSEDLIVRLFDNYLKSYDITLSSEMISRAFDERFNSVKKVDGNTTYKVEEIYNKSKKMIGLKTTIDILLSK